MHSQKPSYIYLRFLEGCQKLEQTQSFPLNDHTSVKLLEVIAISELNNQPIQVTSLLGMKTIASQATIHRKMYQLVDANLIQLKHKGNNRRTKFIYLTELANDYFNQRGALLKAIKLKING